MKEFMQQVAEEALGNRFNEKVKVLAKEKKSFSEIHKRKIAKYSRRIRKN